jgi:ubiquinone/menaquinone biosynthesis C-methylase UbiE
MPDATARFFDAMAPSYDDLEPWYRHFYARLHGLLRATLPPPAGPGARALDAGCGTGFQTAIVAEFGYRAHGLDLSAGSLSVAGARLPAARLVRGDLRALPYRDASFDAVVCAGSTLDFVEDPGGAISELARVMRPGGTLFLEVERRFCLDLGWMLLSSLTGDPLGYGLRPAQAWALLARPPGQGVWLDYPGYPRLRLFTDRELRRMLRRVGLYVERAWGIHAVTNLLPSTWLHRPRVPVGLRSLHRALCAVDAAVGGWRATRALAPHAVVLARKGATKGALDGTV